MKKAILREEIKESRKFFEQKSEKSGTGLQPEQGVNPLVTLLHTGILFAT